MIKPKRTPHERAAELRALLGCRPTQRTVEAARAVVAERDQLRRRVKDLEAALAVAWNRQRETDEEKLFAGDWREVANAE